MNPFALHRFASVLQIQLLVTASLPASPQSTVSPGEWRRTSEQLGVALRVRILVEPGLKLRGATSAADSGKPIDSLDRIVIQNPNARWAALQIRKDAPRNAAAARTLASTVRKGFDLALMNAVFEDTHERRCTTVIRTDKADKEIGRNTAYLLYSRIQTDDGLPIEDQFALAQSENLEFVGDLGVQDRPNPMLAWVQALKDNPPSDIERAVKPIAEAGMRLWENTSAQQRKEMMETALRVGQTYGTPGPPLPDTAATVPIRSLKSLAASVASRARETILVDPLIADIPVRDVPRTTDPVDSLLDLISNQQGAIGWQRVYLPREGDLPSSRALSMAARAAGPNLEFSASDPNGKGGFKITREDVNEGFADALAARGYRSKPIYLIYARHDHAQLAGYGADLLRKQMALILKMNADQLHTVMDQVAMQFAGGDPATREHLMGLPIMAGMMAAWMPRAAKEETLPRP